MFKCFSIKNRYGLHFFNKNTPLDTRKYNIQVVQIKNFVEVNLSFIVPSTQAAFAICIAREILCFKKLPALGSSVHMLRFL